MDQTSTIRIRSREDFQRVLADALTLAKQLGAKLPNFPPFQNVIRQLEAMLRWTANDRIPTAEERNSIDVALVAVRELEGDPDREVQNLSNYLFELNTYFDSLTGQRRYQI